MSWRLVLIKDSEELRLKLDNLLIISSNNEYIIPLSDISMIVLEGRKTSLTTRLLAKAAEYQISIIICGNNYTPVGIYHPYLTHSRASKIIQKQITWDELKKQKIWQEIMTLKITNQQKVLKAFNLNEERIMLLTGFVESIELGDSTNREGHAAKVYFNTLFGNEFNRRVEENVINGALNYGYTIFRSYFTRLVSGYGLLPAIGVFHKSEYNQFNLVDDLMEPFRPIVDA